MTAAVGMFSLGTLGGAGYGCIVRFPVTAFRRVIPRRQFAGTAPSATASFLYSRRSVHALGSTAASFSRTVTSLARPTPSSNPGPVRVDIYCRTDVGRTREHNEDAFLAADLTAKTVLDDGSSQGHELGERGLLFVVADGMGGAAAGELASSMAVREVFDQLQHRDDPWLGDPVQFVAALHDAALAANGAIHAHSVRHPDLRGMGTTATIAGLLGDTVYLAQVGDSRAYLVRAGEARQLTKDQSLIQKLVEVGEMSQEEAERSERRNIILQALGPEDHVIVDLTEQPVRRGDVLVLCSDGLSGLVPRNDIASTVSGAPSLEAAGDALIALANENGGPDNITVVLVRFEGAGLDEVQPDDDVGYRMFDAEAVRTGEMRAVRAMTAVDAAVPRRQRSPHEGFVADLAPGAQAAADAARRAPTLPPEDLEARQRVGRLWMQILAVLAVIAASVVAWMLLR